MRESAWTEAIELCYSNCSSVCGSRCFDDAFAQCKYDLTRTQPALEMLLQAKKAKKKTLFLSLSKCGTPTFAMCPKFNSKKQKPKEDTFSVSLEMWHPHFCHMSEM